MANGAVLRTRPHAFAALEYLLSQVELSLDLDLIDEHLEVPADQLEGLEPVG